MQKQSEINKSNLCLTSEKCLEILKKMLKSEKVKLLDFKVEPELNSVGYLGEYYYLHLNYQSDKDAALKHTRLFVKSLPYGNEEMSKLIESSGMLRKEITLYGQLFNELRTFSKTIWCPDCFLTRDDLFVLENLNDLNYVPIACDTDGFLDETQMLPLLKSLAAMHASCIAYERKHNVSIGEKFQHIMTEHSVHPTITWYTAGLRACLAVALEHPKYKNDPLLKDFIETKLPSCLDTLYDMVTPSKEYRNVLCHRDIWTSNIFQHKLRPKETSCVLVDYQLTRYSPPALDVLQALYLNCKPKVLKAIMARCCAYYYENLSQELGTMGLVPELELSRSEFMQSLEEFKIFGATYNCIASTSIRVPDNYVTYLKNNHPEEYNRFLLIDRTEKILEFVRTNKEFGNYMFDCIEQMLDVAIKLSE